MTVNEIEARTGLDRGTVRYYEAQGLIRPAREANGYRNYSQADLEKLLKVKLLRALNFSVDDILAMDADAGDFPDRLRARVRSLEARQEDLEDAKRVLGLMLSDGARYETLNAGRYLRSMENPPKPPLPAREDVPRAYTAPGPWRRYLARTLDLSILELLYLAAAVLVFHAPVLVSLPWLILGEAAALVLTLLLEPACLALFGATPGKAVLGIRVLTPEGENLSCAQAFRRTWGALLFGRGLGIPVLSLIFPLFCLRDARRGVKMVWERDSREELLEAGLGLSLACGLLAAAVLISGTYLGARSFLPPNRGALTPEELAENVNRRFLLAGGLAGYPALEDPGFRLRADGLWDSPQKTAHVTGDFSPGRVELTVEDGAVTGLAWRQSVTGTGRGCYGRLGQYVAALVWGLVGSDRDLGLFDLRFLLRDAGIAGFRGFDITAGRWRVQCDTFMPDGSQVYSGAVRFPGGGTGVFGVELRVSPADEPGDGCREG